MPKAGLSLPGTGCPRLSRQKDQRKKSAKSAANHLTKTIFAGMII